MEETTTHRVKEAVASAVEKAAEDPSGAYAVAELGKAYAAITMAEMPANAAKEIGELFKQLEEID